MFAGSEFLLRCGRSMIPTCLGPSMFDDNRILAFPSWVVICTFAREGCVIGECRPLISQKPDSRMMQKEGYRLIFVSSDLRENLVSNHH
jgi:hypothetical protein